MCGIAGIVRWDQHPPPLEDVQVMCDVMAHRGPDDDGFYLDDRAALGMRRLSIIDLETGQQPLSNESGTIWVVLNGEIYNFKELRQELQGRGHRFSTTSDTETIVHLYEDYGASCVEKLRGMFALAVWDSQRNELLLARDRLGIKPLYYAAFPWGIAFASELKSMLQVPQVNRQLSWSALGHFLTFGATPAADSIVDGVHKLEPGCLAILAGQSLRVHRYWDVQFASRRPAHQPVNEQDLIEELRSLLRESVDIHMRSDVPFGAFLSGGVDSSAVVATMTSLLSAPVKTFSIGSSDSRFDELTYAREVARAFRTEHYELVLEPQPADLLEELAWFQDEPLGDSSLIPTYVVSKLAAEHVKVVLSGDGGDEIFAGYDKYVVEQREQRRDHVPAPVRSLLATIGRAMPEGMTGRNFLRHFAHVGPRRYLDSVTIFGPSEQRELLPATVREHVARTDPFGPALHHLEHSDHWLSSLQYWDLQYYLPLDILPKVDRMSMAHSIESRPALLDHRIVEFAASVPPELRLRGTTTKYLFKRAMRGILPDSVIDRPKKGFAIPLEHWLRGEWSGYLRDLLLSRSCRERGIFRPDYINRLFRLHQQGRDLNQHLWVLASFELWCRAFLDGSGRGRLRPRGQRAKMSRPPQTARPTPAHSGREA